MARTATVTKLKPAKESNKINFTKEALDALKARATRYEVYDTATRGLELRVTPNGVKTFRRRKSGQAPVTLGRWGDDITSVDQARLMCDAVGVDYGTGKDVATERRTARAVLAAASENVLDLFERYAKEKRIKGGGTLAEDSVKNYRADLDLLLGPFMFKPFSSLTREIVKRQHGQASVKLKRKRMDGTSVVSGSPFRADRALHCLAAMDKFFKINSGVCAGVYEAGAVTVIGAKEPRADDDEAARIAKWLDAYAKRENKADTYRGIVADMYRLALTTGLRAGSIAKLTVGMVVQVPRDPTRHYLELPGRIMKNKRDATLPLAPAARAVLLERIERRGIANDPNALVFGRKTMPNKPMKDNKVIAEDIIAEFGKDFGLHDMRKVFNSVLAEHVRAPDYIRRILLTRSPKDVEEKHYLVKSARKKIDSTQQYVDLCVAYLHGVIPLTNEYDPDLVEKVRRATTRQRARKGHALK